MLKLNRSALPILAAFPSTLIWMSLFPLMTPPVIHRLGQLHFESIAGLVIVPFVVTVGSLGVPYSLIRKNKRAVAYLISVASFPLAVGYCYYLAIGMAV